ncbi:MAG: stress response translation initiation inhibitor YciH [Fibrobacterota bacterium]
MADGLVYSTESGSICKYCENPAAACTCNSPDPNPLGSGDVRIRRETKGRKGKGVTLISGLPLAELPLKLFARTLKQHCGCGGTVKNGVIEIQGDTREKVSEFLTQKGYKNRIL